MVRDSMRSTRTMVIIGVKRMKLTTMILILLQERSIMNTYIGLLRIYDFIYI
jgi:hypothetical protein